MFRDILFWNWELSYKRCSRGFKVQNSRRSDARVLNSKYEFESSPNYKFLDHLSNPNSLSRELADISLGNLEDGAKENILNHALEENGYNILALNSLQELMSNWANNKEYKKIQSSFEKLHKNILPKIEERRLLKENTG